MKHLLFEISMTLNASVFGRLRSESRGSAKQRPKSVAGGALQPFAEMITDES